MKRSIVGIVINLLAAAAAVVGLVYYMINAGTTYFVGLGKDNMVIGTVVLAIAALIIWCFFGTGKTTVLDLLPVVVPALLMVGLLTLVNSRVNGIAAITTFESNEQNMADLQSAIISMGALGIAAVLSCIAAFFSVKKEIK